MRKELWDRQGVNIASHWQEMYSGKLFWRPGKRFWGEINDFSPLFYLNAFGQYSYMENVSFCLNNRRICDQNRPQTHLLVWGLFDYREICIEENIKTFKTRLISRGFKDQMVQKTVLEVKYKDRK